jgi:hypothetical protein
MLKKMALIAALGAFALAAPAFAQGSAPATATKTETAKPVKKAHAKRTCWDLAYESQAQKDCLAKGDATKSSAAAKPAKAAKKSAKKPA